MGEIIQSKKFPYALLMPQILFAILLFLLAQGPKSMILSAVTMLSCTARKWDKAKERQCGGRLT